MVPTCIKTTLISEVFPMIDVIVEVRICLTSAFLSSSLVFLTETSQEQIEILILIALNLLGVI